MQATNVYEHITAKWDALKRLHDQEQKHHADARATWPEIARRMAELRATYRSDNDFGAELVKHGIEYGKNDRAAFIWMGQIKPAALEDAIARCSRRSPETFKREVESWNDDYFVPEVSEVRKPPADTEVEPTSPEKAPIDPPCTNEQIQPQPVGAAAGQRAKPNPRSALSHLPAAVGESLYAAIGCTVTHQANAVISALINIKDGKRAAHAFLAWWAKHLDAGTARQPLVQNGAKLYAAHIVAGLDKSFGDYRTVYAAGSFHKKEAEHLMDEFSELLDAARDGLSLTEYQRKRHASRAGAVQQHSGLPWEHKLPARQITSEGLPDTAELRDGTRLHPAPIAVCGVQHFPSLNYGAISYEDALTFAHLARSHVVEPRLAAGKDHKDIGLEVALMGTHLVGRQFPEAGRLLSAIGQSLRSRGGDIDPALWFAMEPLPPKTAA